MLALLLASAIASVEPTVQSMTEAAHAMDIGRLDQARTMIARAVASGAKGAPVERLLADLAFRSGNNSEALARYQVLLGQNPADLLLAERAGIAALKMGDTARAAQLLERSTASPATSWSGWNARGVIADLSHDWAAADTAYAEAARRSPGQAEVYNNMGWSKLLRGDWAEGLQLLLRAAELNPRSERIRDNLELAGMAVAEELPRRHSGESDRDWAARLNDAGVMARIGGDKARAIAAFTQAIEARNIWFERAANNLELARATR